MQIFGILILLFWSYSAMAQQNVVVPKPQWVTYHSGRIPVSKLLTCSQFKLDEEEIAPLLRIFKSYQNNASNSQNKYALVWEKMKTWENDEAYEILLGTQRTVIKYGTYAGAVNGTMTLIQLMLLHDEALQTQVIKDVPRYGFRALMVDPARHFLTVEELKKMVRAMALYKYNALHLHLNDDQGWRIEVKSHPEIVEKGSVVNGEKKYYTQAEMKELIAYAADYHVEIIPEIDLPGHTTGLLVSHPELACKPADFKLWTDAGVSEDILCAGNEDTYTILKDILEELVVLFPSEKFHLGGDEAPLKRWENCVKCGEKLKALHLKTYQELFSYFLNCNNEVLAKHQKQPMFWYELDIPSYPKNAICYYWRMGKSVEVIQKLGKMGVPMVGSSGEFSYFDYPQYAKDKSNASWMPVTSFEQVTKYDPNWQQPTSQTQTILGVEATLWGEYLPHIQEVLYMTFPRALPFSEAGWCTENSKTTLQQYKNILPLHLKMLTQLGIHYRNPYELYE